MNFQSLRNRFISLLHPTAVSRVDLVINKLGEDEQVFISIDKELLSIGPVEQANICLEKFLNGSAPEYWVKAQKTILDSALKIKADEVMNGVTVDWENNPEYMHARVLAAFGWVDRRIGVRTISKEASLPEYIVERRLKALRQGFPAPAKIIN